MQEILDAGDSAIHLDGNPRCPVLIGSQPRGSGARNALHQEASLPATLRRQLVPRKHADAPFGQWNRFVIRREGSQVTVTLQGGTVIARAELPGIPGARRSGAAEPWRPSRVP